MKTRYSSELLWSNLSNTPVFVYDEVNDFYICFWNGVLITRSCALIIISKLFLEISPSEQQKYVAMKDILKVYKTYGIKINDEFDSHHTIITEIMRYISKNEKNFFENLTQKYDVRQALSWLLKSKERVNSEV